jgi:hypothetical protein
MTHLSDRQHDAFDNPVKAACREGNLRVLREAAYSACRWAGRMKEMTDQRLPVPHAVEVLP